MRWRSDRPSMVGLGQVIASPFTASEADVSQGFVQDDQKLKRQGGVGCNYGHTATA